MVSVVNSLFSYGLPSAASKPTHTQSKPTEMSTGKEEKYFDF